MSGDLTGLQSFWLDRLRQGDSEARNELIRHSQERFRKLTRQMLRNYPGLRAWEDTSDILQNVLLRIDRVLRSIRVTTPRDLMRLATLQIRRELLDLTRHHYGPLGQGTHQALLGQIGDALPEPADQRDDPYRLAEWTELHESIANLPEEERELFELLYYQELTQDQAANILEVSVDAVQKRWLKARIKFMAQRGGKLPF